ncbi:DUF4190 domain-containing protein [Candidatus Woesearchaeota archaeon]|nr:DUF4190 domain-containing protein [Candidatus Woesearchaeota archaeon]
MSKSTTALVLGIIGVVLIFLFPLVGIVLSILAVVFAAQAKKVEKNGKVTAALVLGIVGIVGNLFSALLWVGILAMFGVMEPEMMMPDRCVLPSGLSCQDSFLTVEGVAIKVYNSFGQDITVTEVKLTNLDTQEVCTAEGPEIPKDSIGTLYVLCDPYEQKTEKLRYDVEVTYRFKGSDIDKLIVGELAITR